MRQALRPGISTHPSPHGGNFELTASTTPEAPEASGTNHLGLNARVAHDFGASLPPRPFTAACPPLRLLS